MRVDAETLAHAGLSGQSGLQRIDGRTTARRYELFAELKVARTADMALLEVKELDKTSSPETDHLRDQEALSVEEQRLCVDRRPVRLRQEHVPSHRRRLPSRDQRRDQARRPTIRRPPGSRHDVPGSVAVPRLTAIENICWPLEMKGMPKAERLAKAPISRSGASVPLRRLSGRAQRRDEAAHRPARLFALDSKVRSVDEPLARSIRRRVSSSRKSCRRSGAAIARPRCSSRTTSMKRSISGRGSSSLRPVLGASRRI
jgi:hypothetical protein